MKPKPLAIIAATCSAAAQGLEIAEKKLKNNRQGTTGCSSLVTFNEGISQ